jgi:XisI protein
MDTVDTYRAIVRQLLQDYGQHRPSHGEIDTEIVIDPTRDHYEMLHVGWDGQRRVHGSVIHIDIIDGKIWIQHDGTAPGVAVELVELGVPPEAIVLGFRPQNVRQYSGFAVA